MAEQSNAQRTVRNTNWLFLGNLCFVTAVSFWMGRSGIALSGEINLIVSQLLFWIPIVVYLAVTRTNPLRLIPFRKISVSTALMVILFAILLIPVTAWINLVSMLFVENTVIEIDQQMTGNTLVLNLALMAVLPAISEECMVRGVYFQQYKSGGILKAAVISGAVFGFMHLNFNQFSYALVLGMVFALLVEATGSIFSSVIAHFTFNAQSVVTLWIQNHIFASAGEATLEQVTRADLIEMLMGYTTFACIMGVLAFGVFLWIVHHCGSEDHMKQIFLKRQSADGKKVKMVTPAFAAGAVFAVGIMILMERIV
ncbi:MAG: type II CAAX endopeptidase family protein [Eubacteriales bacterium]|nr:type II CAAX endopeptidase family protein [Eubacteriales bacterium]